MKALYRRPLVWLVLVASLSTWVGMGSAKGATGAAAPVPVPVSAPISGPVGGTGSGSGVNQSPTITVSDSGPLSRGSQSAGRKDTYNIYYSSKDGQSSPTEVKKAIATVFQSWTGVKPKDDTFYIVSLRLETGWGIATLAYDDTIADQEVKDGAEYDSTIFLAKTKSSWVASLAEDTDNTSQVLKLIPSSQLDEKTKDVLAKRPDSSQFNKAGESSMTAATSLLTPVAQNYYGYQLPWPANDSYNKGSKGWHFDDKYDLDFVPNQSASNSEILSVAGGSITKVCKWADHNQAAIYISSADGEFRYRHLAADSVALQVGAPVYQGQYLGKLLNNTEYITDTCGHTTGAHLHFSMPKRPMVIDGLLFASDSRPTGPSTQCSARVLNYDNPQEWVIDFGSGSAIKACSIKGDVSNLSQDGSKIGIGNMEIKNDMAVTISSQSDKCVGVENCSTEDRKHKIETKFNLDTSKYRLLIRNGSKMLINKEAKLY